MPYISSARLVSGSPRWGSSSVSVFLSAIALGLTLACPSRAADGTSQPLPTVEADAAVAAENRRLADDVQFLAADAQEGRGPGTKGIDLAADFLRQQFEQMGLKTQLFQGSPFQKFKLTLNSHLGKENSLGFVGPAGPADAQALADLAKLTLDRDFNPLALGGSAKFDAPLVFVGYGITAPKLDYDDYAGVSAQGKAVIVLRHEPQQDNPHSGFNGRNHSEYAPFMRKVSNAYEHGAAAVIFVTDDFDIHTTVEQQRKRWAAAVDELAEAQAKFKTIEHPTEDDWKTHLAATDKLTAQIQALAADVRTAADPLLGFDQAGSDGETRNMPVLYCRRSVVERLLQTALGQSLGEIEKQIDDGPKPHSAELLGWRAIGQTSIEREETEVKNVAAMLEGEGPLAEQTIIIGAHYDHLGYGGPSSAAPGSHEIHNGADDNASGTAALLEVARQLAARSKTHKLPRRILFLAFTGEERGLLGSAHYVRNPLFPLDQTVAMLNMDMVGRLDGNKLIIHGTGTASELDPLIDRLGKEFGFDVTKKPGGFGPSDHSTFYAKQMPVLHFFTGTHADYHRPSDDADKVNVDGMRRVADLVTATAVALADNPTPLTYQQTETAAPAGGGGDRPYFGSIPDFAATGEGYGISGASKGSPADKGGLKAGDLIIRFGDSRIGNLEDFDSALRKFKAGDKVPVVVKRGSEEVQLEVTLDPPR